MKMKLLLTLILASSIALVGCGKKGPAEDLGEKIDDKVNQVEDKLQNRGPFEKAGDRIDDAMDTNQ